MRLFYREKRTDVGYGYPGLRFASSRLRLLRSAASTKSLIQGGGIRSKYSWRFLAFLILVSLRPASAQEEVRLTQSINVLSDHQSGVSLITKVWENESDARNRFVIELFSKAQQAGEQGSYYERVLSFANGKQVEFSNWMAPDCSLSQAIVFRVRSRTGEGLVVGTAERVASASLEIVPQSDPRPQRIRLFIPKKNAAGEAAGKSALWFDSVKEKITEQSLCEADEIRAAINNFLVQNMTSLNLR